MYMAAIKTIVKEMLENRIVPILDYDNQHKLQRVQP